jgi:hypothetical protein
MRYLGQRMTKNQHSQSSNTRSIPADRWSSTRPRSHGQSKALVLIDDAPIRNGLIRDLHKLKKSYQKIADQINHHETVVRPAFHYWYFERFGKRARLVEQLREEFEEKFMLLQRMRELYTWRGLTRQKAYDRAQQDLAALKKKQEADAAAAAESRHQRGSNDDDSQDESGDDNGSGPGATDSRARETDDAAETSEFSARWANHSSAKSASSAQNSLAKTREQQIKSIYRKLVQVLHPDRASEDNPGRRLYWQETQDAYRSGDLPRLVQLWADCLIDVNPLSRELRVFDLLAKIARLKIQMKEVQRDRRMLVKSDPTWNFEKKSRESIAQEVSSELFEAETDLSTSIRGLAREIKSFSGGASAQPKPRSRQRPHSSRSRQSMEYRSEFDLDDGLEETDF